MFTGIIEEIGKVRKIERQSNSIKLTIEANVILDDVKLGDSIATNGICLTVSSFSKNSFTVDVMPETVYRTNLNDLKVNDLVNLERALMLNGRLGGHIVSGHVDGTGRIVRKINDDKAVRITIEASKKILSMMVEKGSVTIDGISLTITDVTDADFSVSIVNHTQNETTITAKNIGDIVNIENDIIGKYISKFVDNKGVASKSGITLDFLIDNDF